MTTNNSIKRINALLNRIVTSAALEIAPEARKLEADAIRFKLREETIYVLRNHTLPMHTHGKTLFLGKQANWELNLAAGSIYIGF